MFNIGDVEWRFVASQGIVNIYTNKCKSQLSCFNVFSRVLSQKLLLFSGSVSCCIAWVYRRCSPAEVINWLSKGLPSVLDSLDVEPDLTKLALSGHSRGGKAAFALALGLSMPVISLPISLLIGIDPVAGPSKCLQTTPKILTGEAGSFNLKIPISVIGTGLGSEQKSCITPPCAPDGLNHEEFIKESNPPYCYFVTKEYGHMDMLDDEPGCIGKLSSCLCMKGKGDMDSMRRCVGGIVVAFLKAYFDGDDGDLKAIVDDPSIAPVILDPVSFIEI